MGQNRSSRASINRILGQAFQRHPVLTTIVVVFVVGWLLMRDGLPTSTSEAPPASADRAVSIDSQESSGPTAEDLDSKVESPATSPLTRLTNDVYLSAAGLRYTAGSQHGHRLKHLMAHSRDAPDRPGQHGVFNVGGQDEIVTLIDEAYRVSQQGGRRVRERVDRDRKILTVDMQRQIGYVGGQSGNRRGRPPARHLRLVLEDDRVITAYPVVP